MELIYFRTEDYSFSVGAKLITPNPSYKLFNAILSKITIISFQ